MSDETLISAAEVARLAGISRAAVSNWRRRRLDFPQPAGGTDTAPTFRLGEVEEWLQREGKLQEADPEQTLWRALDAGRGDADMGELVARVAAYLSDPATSDPPNERVRSMLDQTPTASRADLVERLCERYFALQQRQHLMTPRGLAEMMVELAGPAQTVFDPACGPGNLLHAAAARGIPQLAGQEVNESLATMARARLRFSGCPRVAAGDSLRDDAFPDLRADAVVCEPPFGYREWGHEQLAVDPRWEYGVPVKGESELAWVQHCLARTRPGGRVVMLLPASVAFRRSGRRIRQELVRRGVVRAVVALPAGLLMSTGIPLHLWVLRPEGASEAGPVLMVDASRHAPPRRGRVDWAALRAAVLAPWQEFQSAGTVDDIVGQQRAVSAIELLDEDVDLSPAQHLPQPALDLDPAALNHTTAGLSRTLGELAALLPQVAPSSPEPRPATTINDLARAGALTVRQHVGKLDITEDENAAGPPVLTGRDVAAGSEPTARLAGEPGPGLITLQPGDLVVPHLAAGSKRSLARVIHTDGVLLGPNLQLIRVNEDRLDVEFLAGQLRSAAAQHASSSTASGVHRLDIRRVEIPVLDLDEQRRLGEAYRRLATFQAGIEQAAQLGTDFARQLTDGLAEGAIDWTD